MHNERAMALPDKMAAHKQILTAHFAENYQLEHEMMQQPNKFGNEELEKSVINNDRKQSYKV